MLQIVGSMRALQQQIPAVAWLLVLPQLISRICHQQQEVQEVTQAIIARVAQVRALHICTCWAAITCAHAGLPSHVHMLGCHHMCTCWAAITARRAAAAVASTGATCGHGLL